MKPLSAILCVVCLAMASFACGEENAGEKKPAKADALELPSLVVVPLGGTGYLSVKVDREVLAGPLRISVEGLPAELSIVDKEPVHSLTDKNDTETSFTLRATANAPIGPVAGARIVVTGNGIDVQKPLDVDVRNFRLRTASWIVMIVSVGCVLLLTSFCVLRVLRLPPVEEETLKGPLEIDTGDTYNAD